MKLGDAVGGDEPPELVLDTGPKTFIVARTEAPMAQVQGCVAANIINDSAPHTTQQCTIVKHASIRAGYILHTRTRTRTTPFWSSGGPSEAFAQVKVAAADSVRWGGGESALRGIFGKTDDTCCCYCSLLCRSLHTHTLLVRKPRDSIGTSSRGRGQRWCHFRSTGDGETVEFNLPASRPSGLVPVNGLSEK